jgi:hypothetical protein
MARELQAYGGPADGGFVSDPGGLYVYLDGCADVHGDVRAFPAPGPDRGLYLLGAGRLAYQGPAAWVCECGAILSSGPDCQLCGAGRSVKR